MAGRRNATPLFDLIGPLADADEKPRYRSSAPPPAPDQTPEPEPEQPLDVAAEEQSLTAVAEPTRRPIEVHTARTLVEQDENEPNDEPIDQPIDEPADELADEPGDMSDTPDMASAYRSQRSTTVEETAPQIETRSAPHGNPAPMIQPQTQHEPEPVDTVDTFETPASSGGWTDSNPQTEADPFATKRTLADLKELLLTGTNRLYFTSGVVIIGLVIVWFVLNAVLAPNAAPDLDTSADLQTHAEGGIVDPLSGESSSSATRPNTSQPGPDVPTIRMGAGGTQSQTSPTPSITVDPRVSGQNYLRLASNLSRDEATRAATFLTDQGCPAIAVGMDSGTLEGNNREQFLLVSLFDVPVGRYVALRSDRQAHVRRIGVLGGIWTKDHGGTVNFHDPFWKKYDP